MQLQQIQWHVFENSSVLRQAACESIVDSANRAIAERGKFLIVLAGGSTPRDVYRLLRDAKTDWSKWQVYYGDERCLPLGHTDRNSRMAEDAWLTHVAIPPQQIHTIPAELGPEQGAAIYCRVLDQSGEFDLVLLGLGEDGHTASLFPGNVRELDGAPAIPVRGAPKPPPERISLSASRLSQSRQVIVLVTGAGKRQAVQQWRQGINLPVAAITPPVGMDVWLDQAAAGTSEIPYL